MDEAKLKDLEVRYGKIGVVPYNRHTCVFRRPTRADVRDYKRKLDTPAEKADAMDQLAQATIVAFDQIDDPNAARVIFTGQFLEEYPLAISNPRFVNCLSLLAGLVEEADEKTLGEGFSVRPSRPAPSPTV